MGKFKELWERKRQQWQEKLDTFNDFAATQPKERITGRDIVMTVVYVLVFGLGLGFLMTDDRDQPRTVLTLRKYVDSCLIGQVDIDPDKKVSGFYVKSTDRGRRLPPPQVDQQAAERILQDAHKIFPFHPGDRVAVTYNPAADECQMALLVRDPNNPGSDAVYVRTYIVDKQGKFYGPQQSYTIRESDVSDTLGDMWLELPADYQPLLASRP